MKPVDHPKASGDRRMARSFLKLFDDLGHDATVTSVFRSYERDGDQDKQLAIHKLGLTERAEIKKRWESLRWEIDLWFTYHPYHKSPDWLGPELCAYFQVPYIVAEASFAGKQSLGRWSIGHGRAQDTLRSASAVLAMTRNDKAGLEDVVDTSRLWSFPPFIDETKFEGPSNTDLFSNTSRSNATFSSSSPLILTVAMVRDDVKFLSYRLMAQSLASLRHLDWHWLVVGDGPKLPDLKSLTNALIPGRVSFYGRATASELREMYRTANFLAWPALREAYGMVFLEAMASGLPIVAGRDGGVVDVLSDGDVGLVVNPTVADFAGGINSMLQNHSLRESNGLKAKDRVHRVHSWAVAKNTMRYLLQRAIGAHRTAL